MTGLQGRTRHKALGVALCSVLLFSATARAATVSVEPASTTLPNVGASDQVGLEIDNAAAIISMSFTVTYNSAVVRAIAVDMTPPAAGCTVAISNGECDTGPVIGNRCDTSIASDCGRCALDSGTFCANDGDCIVSGGVCNTGTCNNAIVNDVRIAIACSSALSGQVTVTPITFEGVGVGSSTVTISQCTLEASGGTLPCTPVAGTIDVQGPPTSTPTITPTETSTSTPTLTPTITPTSSPTLTPTITPTSTPTSTFTEGPSPTPTETPTETPTVTSTATATTTPTVTPTGTPTSTPTSTPVPIPRITGGTTRGSTQVSGVAAATVGIEIYSTGPDGEIGGGDDELLGSGTSNEQGLFTVSLSRGLIAGESIYPVDTTHGINGVPVTVREPAPIPATTPLGVLALIVLLGGGLLWRARRGRA